MGHEISSFWAPVTLNLNNSVQANEKNEKKKNEKEVHMHVRV